MDTEKTPFDDVYTVALSDMIKELSLGVVSLPAPAEEITLSVPRVNRPGLQLAGFYDYYEASRVQIFGKAEMRYLQKMEAKERHARLDRLFATKPAAAVVTSGLTLEEEDLAIAARHGVPMLSTEERTSEFQAALIAYLNLNMAPRITRHGVLVEVYGEGILLLGDSGVGKSETAIELVKRGHRLIADDAVEIKRVSAKALVGQAPEIIRHYVELRGIGVVDVRRLFGMGAVKNSEKIDLIINLEPWVQGKMYDRLGIDEERTEILGISLPSMTIPVRPGRNLSIIIEVAAMNNRQKKMGYNTAEEFNKRIMESMGLH
ncbi:MAG: HPr(Ser) kinase/phosphatase [Clostridia bacterium]|nr:HPr(Ser) kinase/phosphatase [Clostridia bacterium]